MSQDITQLHKRETALLVYADEVFHHKQDSKVSKNVYFSYAKSDQ